MLPQTARTTPVLGSVELPALSRVYAVKTCLVWMEAHPEVAYEADKQYRPSGCEDLVWLTSSATIERSGVNARTGGEQLAELAERKQMKKCYGKPPPKT